MLKALDLFCGAGGLTRGLVASGFDIAGAIDRWEPARRSYAANFPEHRFWTADVGSINASEILRETGKLDLIAGGPPCQGFSIQRIGDDHDERNSLILSFSRLVSELRPRMFMLENVPGLLGRRGRQVLHRFSSEARNCGYDLRQTVLDAAEFGIPQVRRRVFIVGWQRDQLEPFQFPQPLLRASEYRTVREAIGDLPSPPENFTPPADDPLHRRIRLSARNLERLSLIPPGGGFVDLPVELRAKCHRAGADRIGHRNVYGRLEPDRPAATITARFDSFTRGQFGHPWENRNITLREGARLQGFPDDHVFLGTQEEIAALIGNAVPPPLATLLGKAIGCHLAGYASQVSSCGQSSFEFLATTGQPQLT